MGDRLLQKTVVDKVGSLLPQDVWVRTRRRVDLSAWQA